MWSNNDRSFLSRQECFSGFSEELWEEISSMTDENNKIKLTDIPVQTYDMYKCPTCGRLMIFGEDEDASKFTIYKQDK